MFKTVRRTFFTSQRICPRYFSSEQPPASNWLAYKRAAADAQVAAMKALASEKPSQEDFMRGFCLDALAAQAVAVQEMVAMAPNEKAICEAGEQTASQHEDLVHQLLTRPRSSDPEDFQRFMKFHPAIMESMKVEAQMYLAEKAENEEKLQELVLDRTRQIELRLQIWNLRFC